MVHAITQRRLLPTRATARGAANWITAPARIGTLATIPEAIGPIPRASANAGRYVSPQPTMTLKAIASIVETSRSRRRLPRGGRKGWNKGRNATPGAETQTLVYTSRAVWYRRARRAFRPRGKQGRGGST